MKKNILILLLLCLSVGLLGQPLRSKYWNLPKKFSTDQTYNPKKMTQSQFLGRNSKRTLIKGSEKPNSDFEKNQFTGQFKPDTNLIINNYDYEVYLSQPRIDTIKTYLSVFTTKDSITHPDINYGKLKTNGWVMVSGGIMCQVAAVSIFAVYYEPTNIYNRVRITNDKIFVRSEISNNDNTNVIIISSLLGLIGTGLEICGGIKIHNANIGLNGITIPITK